MHSYDCTSIEFYINELGSLLLDKRKKIKVKC